jgi:hypothetical protein
MRQRLRALERRFQQPARGIDLAAQGLQAAEDVLVVPQVGGQ